MGVLARLRRPLQRLSKADDSLDPFQVGRKGEKGGDITPLISKGDDVSRTGQRSVGRTLDNDLQAGLRRTLEGPATRYGAGTGLGILGAGAAGSGAWIYTQDQKTKREEERSERYAEYQSRIEEIEQMYQNGEISKAERDRLLEKAQEDYRYQENPDAIRNFSQWLASLGTFETLALIGLFAGTTYWVIAPAARDFDWNKVIP